MERGIAFLKLTPVHRFGHRDTKSSLFSAYDAQTGRKGTSSPSLRSQVGNHTPNPMNPNGMHSFDNHYNPSNNSAFSAYPAGGGSAPGQYRSATPNSRGQYSDAVLSELESQNDEQMEGMSARVRMLKEVVSSHTSRSNTSHCLRQS